MTTAPPTPAPAAWDNPTTVAPRGTIVLIAGRGEHPGVYERFGTRIAFDGYRVRVVGDPTTDPEATLAEVVRLFEDENLPVPHVLAGSDAGALFAASLVATGKVSADALLLAGLPTAPGSPAAWTDELGERTACPTHRARLDNDPQVRRGALEEPLPEAWFVDADLSRTSVPVLGVHGEADLVSPVDAAREAYARAPRAELVTVAHGKHDALNDATHRTAAAAVVLFLERLRLGDDLAPIAHWSGGS
jgi:pimeloyl-ACP methyl ester carboxylesterase